MQMDNGSVEALGSSIVQNVSRVLVGKEAEAELCAIALLSRGHILIEDVPGVGKTMLAKSLARSLGCSFERLQFTPDLLPSDVTGVNIYSPSTQQFEFRQGPVFTQVLLADEINRATPKTQSALLEAMEERQVTVDGTTYRLPMPFLVLATQNPVEFAGTFPLPEAQVDRFLIRVNLGYLDVAHEVQVLDRFQRDSPIEQLEAVVSADDVLAAQRAVQEIYVDEQLKDYIARVTHRTRSHADVGPFGLFPRTLRVPGSRSVVVYPVIRPVGALEALAPSNSGDEQLRGRVLDIPPNATTIREYVPTDSVKRIHWASSARLARLMSRSFETREGGDAWIVLDLQASVHAGEAPESTLEYAMSMAASITDAGLRRGSAIGLVTNDSQLSVIEAARGDQQRKKLLEHFTLAQADGSVPLSTLLTAQRQQWKHRGGLIVITPSSDEDWLQALLDLNVRGHRSLVIYLDPQGFGGRQPSLA